MASIPTAKYDLMYLQSCLEILQDYLLSDDLYWTVRARPPAGDPSFSQMTISSLLLADARLNARSLSWGENAELSKLEEEMEQISSQWRVAWERKSNREFTSRLNLWGNFIDEYRKGPENHYDRYAYEVGRRVMLELLAPFITDASSAELELLRGLDGLLRTIFQPGDFIWAAELIRGFPRETYWYLYGRLCEKALS